jgi:outer membrane protein assembly factor BamB
MTFSRLLLGLALLPGLLCANVQEPSWRSELTSPINWQHMTTTGTLLVNTRDGLHGLDARTGKTLWQHANLASVVADNVEEIPRSPLVVLDDGADDTRIVILNLMDGTIVFDSRAEGLVQILDKRLLPRSRGLLIAGFEPGKPETTLFVYDLADGKRRWRSDALHASDNRLMTFLTAVIEVTQDISPLHAGPIELKDGSFLLSANGKIFRMGSEDGNVVWQQSFPWGAPQLYLSDAHPDRVFVGSQYGGEDTMEGNQSAYTSLDVATGKPHWAQPVKFRGAFNPHIVFAERGLVISEHTQGKGWVRMLDYETGESLWGKKGRGHKVKGGIVDHAFFGNDLVVTTGFDSAWNDKGTEYLLYVLDARTGEPHFDKPALVKGRLRYTKALPTGLLYVTSHEVNVLDPRTGTLVNDTLVRARTPVVTTADDDRLYAYNGDDGLLYRLSLATGTIQPLSATKLTLEGKDVPSLLELRDNRVVLMGQQSVAAWNDQGSVLFNRHHPAPKRNALLRALLYAQAARAAMASAASGVYAAGFAQASTEVEEGSLGQAVTEGLSEGYTEMAEGYGGLARDYWRTAGERFQASAAARDFVFMMVRQDNKRYGLAQVSKDTGEIMSIIDLGKEKDPAYQVDDIENQIFHQTGPRQLVAYSFEAEGRRTL